MKYSNPDKNTGVFLEKAAEFIYTVLLRQKYIRRIVNRIIRLVTPVAVTYNDAKIYLNPNDPVVSGALTFRVYEKREIAALKKYCLPGMYFFDVGANVGLYTALSSQAVGENGKVFAFEPESQSFAYLKKTIHANHPERIHATQAALADKTGRSTLYVSQENRGDNRLYQPTDNENVIPVDVDVLCFDEWMQNHQVDLARHPVFVKIDVQGFEGRVLLGMRKSLRKIRQLVLMMEFWPKGLREASGDPIAVLEFLASMELTIYDLNSDIDKPPRITDYAGLVEKYPGRHYTNLIAFKGKRQATSE